jgi:hypothetical protein
MVASKSIAALFVLTLAAGAVHAQTAPSCGDGSRAVVPDAIAYADWGDRAFFGAATHKPFVVIRKVAPTDVRTDSRTTPRAVAYGVDVGNQAVLFQITFTSFDELSAFQTRLDANLLFLSQLNLVQSSAFSWGITSDVNKPPPPPPGGPTGIPYPAYLGAQLVGFGTAYFITQNLALGGQ